MSSPRPPAQSPTVSTEDVRAWLDQQRDVILACVGVDLVIVEVAPRGTTAVVGVRPPYAGTPSEECVRAALGRPPSVPRELLVHAVRR